MALTAEEVAKMSPEEKATMRAELQARKDSILTASQPEVSPEIQPEIEPTSGLETVSKSLFPLGTEEELRDKSPQEVKAQNRIDAVFTRLKNPNITPDQKRAEFAELKKQFDSGGESVFDKIASTAINAVTDVGSLFTRGTEATAKAAKAPKGEKGKAFFETIQDPEEGILKDPESLLGFLGSRQESDEKWQTLIDETEEGPAKTAFKVAKFMGNLLISTAEDPINLASGGLKLLGKAPKILKGTEKGLKTATELPGSATAGVSSQLSGVSGEALQEAGLGFGKKAKALKDASEGATFDIGQDLVEKINKFDELIPEAKQINNALENMGEISTDKVLDALESSKVANAATPAAKNANKNIQETIDNLKELGDNLSATEFRKLRIQFDEGIEFGKPGFDAVEKAFSNARKTMAKELVKSARKTGNKEFESTMKTFAEKLKTRDDLVKLLGKNQTAQSSRAETFANTLFGKGKTARRGLVKKFDEVFGSDFFEQIKTAKLSAELGPKGVPQLLPKAGGSRQVATGALAASALAHLKPITLPAVAALASPKVSSKIIGLFDLIGEGTFKTAKTLAKLSVKDEVIAAEAFNTIIKALPKADTKRLADLMDKREESKNERNKQNVDKRINAILQKGNK